MKGIKYYQLAKGEEMPDEFCVVRDVDGEPSEYTFYVPESENAKLGMRVTSLESALDGMHLIREQDKAENAKLRELVRDMWEGYNDPQCEECHLKDTPTCADCPICAREASVIDRMRELGIEVGA